MDLTIKPPRPRWSFREFAKVVAAEHAHCTSHDETGPVKAWHEGRGPTIVWVLRCDACGGWSLPLSASDIASFMQIDKESQS